MDLCFKSFEPLLEVFDEDGWVPDRKYLDLGFPVDMNWAGEPVHRDAGITNEICQRSKLLSALTQRRLRREQAEKQAAKLSAKTELGNAKILAVLADNKACEAKLLELLGKPATTSTRMLSASTMADFSAVLAPHLKAFILARLFDDLEGSRGRSWPKKGKLAEAQQGAEETLIKQAFDLRKGSVRLKAAVVQVPLLPAPVRAAPLVITAGAADSPSDWLKDALWCERVGAAFEGRRAATSCSDGERADLLMRPVSPRLDRHIQQRVDPKKHGSWVPRYVRENLAALAAIAVCFGHAALDPACASMDSPLLRDDCHFM